MDFGEVIPVMNATDVPGGGRGRARARVRAARRRFPTPEPWTL